MRVLITGATGFVGRYMAEQGASQGASVVGLGRRSEPPAELDGRIDDYLQADLLDADATEQAVRAANPDRVFHLAADASVAGSWKNPAKIIEENVASTLNLLEAVRRDAPEARVLCAGSGEQYGLPLSLPVKEDAPLRPQNPYAVSKAAAELTAGFYADAYEMHVARMRAFNHTGPGQGASYVVSSFARQIAEAEVAGEEKVEVVTGNLDARRDFTDVRDVVRAYWLALESGDSTVYNVAAGEASSIQSILDGLIGLARIEVEHRVDPKLLRPNEVPEVVGSAERLRDATGWEPQIDLERTLSDTLDRWRQDLATGETS